MIKWSRRKITAQAETEAVNKIMDRSNDIEVGAISFPNVGNSDPGPSSGMATEEAFRKLQDSYDITEGIKRRLQQNRIDLRSLGGVGENVAQMIENATKQMKELDGVIQVMDDLLVSDKSSITQNQIKEAVIKSAEVFEKAMLMDSELLAVLKVKKRKQPNI